MLELFLQPQTWATLVILSALEIVLSIDNLVFIAILSNKLPQNQQKKARRLGLLMAVGFRVALLATAAWLVKMTEPFITFMDHGFSIRDLILIGGGAFLLWKSTMEIRARVSLNETEKATPKGSSRFAAMIFQIVVIDIVFSIDSIITAVGLAQQLPIMITAVLVAVGLMILASEPLAKFIGKNPTIVMLALAFLVMIGVILVAAGFGYDVPKGYLYVAMAFALGVELLNMWQRKIDRIKSGN